MPEVGMALTVLVDAGAVADGVPGRSYPPVFVEACSDPSVGQEMPKSKGREPRRAMVLLRLRQRPVR